MGLRINKEEGYLEASIEDLTEYIRDFMGMSINEQVKFLIEEHVRIHILKTGIEVLKSYQPELNQLKNKVFRMGIAKLVEMQIDNTLEYGLNKGLTEGWLSDKELDDLTASATCWLFSDEEEVVKDTLEGLSELMKQKINLN